MSREELVALVAAQAEEIMMLRADNEDLRVRLARLERLVSRNSANSSMPPSKDGEPGKTAPDESSKKPGGGGKGASGASSPGRRGRTWRGVRTPMAGWIGSLRVAASAAPSWVGRLIWG